MIIRNSSASAAVMRPIARRVVRLGLVVLFCSGFVGMAAAQGSAAPSVDVGQKQAVSVVLVQFKVVTDAQGREQLVEASTVKPGDVLQYTATYTNNTSRAVTGLVADLPIPEGLEYLPKTARPGAALVKVAAKDGVFAAEPLMRKVGGKSEPVPYGEYRTLRWTLGQLPARGETAVSARAKVEVVVPQPPPTAPMPPDKAPSRTAS